MQLIDCDSSHAETIRIIFNEAIANSTALYEDQPRSAQVIGRWFETKRAGNFPIIGAIDEAGRLLGFASYGSFRAYPGYRYTVEHSVYVAGDHRGQGIGKRLLVELMSRAVAQRYHMMIGVIDAENLPSIQLHEKLGFVRTGLLPQVGFKFGRWLDVVLYQLPLPTPPEGPTQNRA